MRAARQSDWSRTGWQVSLQLARDFSHHIFQLNEMSVERLSGRVFLFHNVNVGDLLSSELWHDDICELLVVLDVIALIFLWGKK